MLTGVWAEYELIVEFQKKRNEKSKKYVQDVDDEPTCVGFLL